MNPFFVGVSLTLLIGAFICLYRAILGPTLFERIIAVNLIGTNVLVVLILMAYLFKQAVYLDVAFAYALLNFVAIIAVTRCAETGGEPK
ncbi:MAG: monovalent cation/H+ antiporter complex subunit F [Actinomycetota bacterium]|nr:monovalent cation/H+ antiporter complex subunit F [Actinomycetota bacterium]